MPDITMCNSVTCPIQDGCYTHKAKPNQWRQSYADFSHLLMATINGFECDNHRPLYKTVATNHTGPIPEPEEG